MSRKSFVLDLILLFTAMPKMFILTVFFKGDLLWFSVGFFFPLLQRARKMSWK